MASPSGEELQRRNLFFLLLKRRSHASITCRTCTILIFYAWALYWAECNNLKFVCLCIWPAGLQ
ncbi:unnamed protein product [Brassica oleracea var. botrytis]|uniref:Uncharacterized protein n=2 Tax=Brassica TaxID=3705 RepID=A0A0D3E6L6_BRAOL|nr:unnamed protein product [Brassica napus]CDY23128.1 BnaC09g18820D [Brassica napus]